MEPAIKGYVTISILQRYACQLCFRSDFIFFILRQGPENSVAYSKFPIDFDYESEGNIVPFFS